MGRELHPGEVFAGFRVRRQLGAGGMGAVYAVEHPRLPRLVALKLLTADAGDAGAVARFDREAETIARLDHPGIVSVLDRGVEHGQPWISMQLVDGTDAGAVVQAHGPMPIERVRRIGQQVAEALDAAHRRGVVHRDVKPANIMLSRAEQGQQERALITDFGIAGLQRAVASDGVALTAPHPVISSDITGLVDGARASVGYASPEQLRGAPTDGRSDQYSLACALFALLTGRGPFTGTGDDAIRGHLTGPVPSAKALRPEVPEEMAAALRKGMSKSPADRFLTCAEMVAALHPADDRGRSHERRRRTQAMLAAVTAIVVATGAYGVWRASADDPDVVGTRGSSTTSSTTAAPTTTGERALWQEAVPVLANWPQLLPQKPTENAYQNMTCAPTTEQGVATKVAFRYKFNCAARETGVNKTTVEVDLFVYAPGQGDKALEALNPPQGVPILQHATKFTAYHFQDPAEGSWILLRYRAPDLQDYHFQVGTKNVMTYSQLYDWIAAAPF